MRGFTRFASIVSLACGLACSNESSDPIPSLESATSDATTGADAGEGAEGESTGDGDATAGDGDGSTGDGDGASGDGTTGDGDGTTGDGDGTSGDGDGTSGDGTTGDGTSGDGTTGDGDGGTGDGDGTSGDGTTGDGDGTSGDGTTGDGDGGTGDGDGTSGDGDGTSGDGDGTSGDGTTGDGDGTTGDGDGTSGDGTTGDGDGTSGDGTTGDGDGTTGDGDGTAGDGDGDGTPCFVEQPMVERVPPNVIFVLDKSGSMMEMVMGQTTRWGALHSTVVSVVTDWETEIAFGAKMFGSRNWALGDVPNNLNQQCAVDNGLEATPALNNLGAIVAGILPANEYISPYCLTPTQSGFERARDWLVQNAAGQSNAIILITDGFVSDGRPIGGGNAPNCAGNTVGGLTQEIGDMWATYGWPTYVVGVDIENSVKDEMNGYADAGGVPASGNTSFYDTSAGSGLTNALQAIAGQIESCTVEMSVASPSPQYTKVFVNGVEWPQISANQCGSQDGWYYSDAPTNLNIELCGVACDDFVSFGSAEVRYFCTAG